MGREFDDFLLVMLEDFLGRLGKALLAANSNAICRTYPKKTPSCAVRRMSSISDEHIGAEPFKLLQ